MEKPENTSADHQEVEALCRECGHGFKLFVDRLVGVETAPEKSSTVKCPVCGCTECSIGK